MNDISDMVMNGLLKQIKNEPFKEPKPPKPPKPIKEKTSKEKVKKEKVVVDQDPSLSTLEQAQEMIMIAFELIKKAESLIQSFKDTKSSEVDKLNKNKKEEKKKRVYKPKSKKEPIEVESVSI
jgi:hypothetical protein